jgi:ribonuclease Z
MASKLIILGSSNAIPTTGSDNTMLAIITENSRVLIDSGINPIVKLDEAGLDINAFDDIIITHFHPDHVSGLPMLLMTMWLTGRKTPITIHGSDHSIDRMEKMMDLFDWDKWPNFFQVDYHRIPHVPSQTILETTEIHISGTPVNHFIPTMGLRMNFKRENKVVGYSCDTEPCPGVITIGKEAHLLIHEATGPEKGHSSAAQAAETAMQANAKELLLIHYPTGKYQQKDIIDEARQVFTGKISRAVDMQTIQID